MSKPKHTLVYLPFGGRAEAIRLAAAIGKVPFTNKAVSSEESKTLKQENPIPLGQLPVLEIEIEGKDKEVVPQTDAILVYFGKLGGLYPEDPIQALKVDSYLVTIQDLIDKISIAAVGPVKTYLSSDEDLSKEQKLCISKRMIASSFPKLLGYLEEAIKKNDSGWLVGDSVTIADIKLYSPVDWVLSDNWDGMSTSSLEPYPNVLKLVKKIETLPEVVKFREKHGGGSKPYGTFDFDPKDDDENDCI